MLTNCATSSPDDLSGDPDTLLLLAVEEAGHAVMAWLEGGILHEVTIVPTSDYPGSCRWSHQLPVVNANIKDARVSLAGPVAAMIFTDSEQFWNDDTHDVEKADAYLTETGVSSCELLPRVRAELERDWPRVMRVTEALLARQRLSGQEATAAIEGAS